jgi:hypothetical protein
VRAALYSQPFVASSFTKYENRRHAPDSSDAWLRQLQPREKREEESGKRKKKGKSVT